MIDVHSKEPTSLPTGEEDRQRKRAEALRSFGFEAHLMRLLHGEGEASKRAEAFLDVASPFVTWLEEDPRLRRLATIRHLGLNRDAGGNYYPHTRLDHSRLVAANAVVIGLMLGVSTRDLLVRLFAGMLHDIGHPCHSHSLDYVLVQDFGFPDHEERGQDFLRHYLPLRGILHAAGITLDEVIAAMREEGKAGACQSISDTLAYVELDSLYTGKDMPTSYARSVMRTITGIEWRKDTAILRVHTAGALLDLLQRRAELFRDVYAASHARLFFGTIRITHGWLFKNRHVDPRDAASVLSDGELDALLDIYCQVKETPACVHSAYKVLLGDMSELERNWTAHRFKRWLDAANFEAERQMRTGIFEGNYIKVRRHDCADKRIEVIDANHRRRSLKAPMPVEGDFANHIYYVYRGR